MALRLRGCRHADRSRRNSSRRYGSLARTARSFGTSIMKGRWTPRSKTRFPRLPFRLPIAAQSKETSHDNRFGRKHHQRVAGDSRFSAAAGIQRAGQHQERGRVQPDVEPGEGRPGRLLGRDGRQSELVPQVGQGARRPHARTRSGLSAAKSTRPTTASTGTCRRGARTRRRSSGKASRAIPACCGIRIFTARCAASRMS